ncbi:MAG: nucleoside triphosphate pyrophosphohydrolase family protein [Myxococcales bacterium]|nr:nucleoside triphosphate pyrophosphohydrolase family protein [Myxococcales bacterium]
MDFATYQALAARTARHENSALDRLTNGALGLGGEGGEVVELVKKHRYHGHVLDTAALSKELGDVLWYLSELCSASGLSLDDVAEQNIQKLRDRYPDGFSETRSKERPE